MAGQPKILDYRDWYDGPLDGLVEVDGRVYCYILHDRIYKPKFKDVFAYYWVSSMKYEEFFNGGYLYIEEANLEPLGFFDYENADWSIAESCFQRLESC